MERTLEAMNHRVESMIGRANRYIEWQRCSANRVQAGTARARLQLELFELQDDRRTPLQIGTRRMLRGETTGAGRPADVAGKSPVRAGAGRAEPWSNAASARATPTPAFANPRGNPALEASQRAPAASRKSPPPRACDMPRAKSLPAAPATIEYQVRNSPARLPYRRAEYAGQGAERRPAASAAVCREFPLRTR